MRATGSAGGRDLRARIRDLDGWTDWIPGLRALRRTADGVDVEIGGPRPFACTLAVREAADGVAVELVQGEIAGLKASIVQVGDELVAELDLAAGVPLPGILQRTLEREVLPGLLRRLASAPGV